jgi:hypothetical protein
MDVAMSETFRALFRSFVTACSTICSRSTMSAAKACGFLGAQRDVPLQALLLQGHAHLRDERVGV